MSYWHWSERERARIDRTEAVFRRGDALCGGGGPPAAEAELAARRQRSRRATFIKWLRKVHGWVGLWGAVLGLMFGVTGFVMNHRAPPLKISPGAPRVSEVQMPLPVPAPKSPARLEAWLIKELKFDAGRTRVRKEAAQPVEWGDRSVMQPEHWQITLLFKPGANVVADYWVGSQAISLKRSDNSLMTTLTNLHRGVGMNIFWVLLMDTIAGSMILLSLTGVLLWTELNKRRTIGVVLVCRLDHGGAAGGIELTGGGFAARFAARFAAAAHPAASSKKARRRRAFFVGAAPARAGGGPGREATLSAARRPGRSSRCDASRRSRSPGRSPARRRRPSRSPR